jgi:hypothetical protein
MRKIWKDEAWEHYIYWQTEIDILPSLSRDK